ncbi:flagellar protein export ATPase FliI [Bacillus subtilis subsp. subtilis]|uniref:Flagellum-specific ATP synthase n=4 Tax=Bacillales TaxID=1385 RepID=FLII_BACSU|nr:MULTISPECIES: flagellar protein export ATPase FliI [Bacillales]NP_389506.2 flagellar-specific ATPase subunit of export apparatus [Bacillus subtilis subsp. subtilis str. 168]P23445.2 RecName: Full=Flagellum-specific ATP synthase [Bacillus subtilis subsp. subtilis str. 168]BAM52270.1 flagellum-specific ATP synthase [Bacillus subtilis BEST7613]AFQ57560.1 Flagellar-specific ATPase [Bacillus subtilis QB928]AGG60996.1 flagellar-specific ATPase FliI [Bacillus subtilis subsp. subtilis 6051-HGW]AHA
MKTQSLIDCIEMTDSYKRYGKVKRVIGLMIESKGPASSIGDLCLIYAKGQSGKVIKAEVVGFQEENILLMPYLEAASIAPGSIVEATGESLRVKVGTGLIGQVIDAFGEPLDGKLLPKGLSPVSTEQSPPNPMKRPPIREKMGVGVRSIDSLLTVGKGQRIGIFAGSGVGKSTLMGMIAKQTEADLNVIALVGERGREVREFIEKDLGKEGLKRSIVVVATSDQPALMRLKAAYTATAIAEYFRDKGQNVMFMMDSVTRVAMAQREIGLAAGEPPTTKGYTPSVFAILPRLLERTGANEHGTITAFYTVLVDGDDMNEPIADTVRGILDGHIVLDRALANKGQFPAVNVLKSISRVMSNISTKQHLDAANKFRELLSTYQNSEDLINIGAYKRGSSREIDEAIQFYPQLIQFLKQGTDEPALLEESIAALTSLTGNEE